MKYPKSPTKPYAPYKPSPPPEKIEKQITLGVLPIETYGGYTFLEYRNLLLNFCQEKGIDVNDVKFEFEIDQEWAYNDCTCSLHINVFKVEMVDHPHYAALKKQYEKDLEKYRNDYAAYKAAELQYDIDLKQYQIDYDAYMLEHNKKEVKRLEKKLSKVKV
jgi:hypothetical protein